MVDIHNFSVFHGEKKPLGIKGTVSCMQMTIYNAHTELSNCFDGKIPTRPLAPEIGLVLLLPSAQISLRFSGEYVRVGSFFAGTTGIGQGEESIL